MKKLLIEAVCNSPKRGGKLKKRIDTLQRFTTLIMLLLCSVGAALAQEETAGTKTVTFDLTKWTALENTISGLTIDASSFKTVNINDDGMKAPKNTEFTIAFGESPYYNYFSISAIVITWGKADNTNLVTCDNFATTDGANENQKWTISSDAKSKNSATFSIGNKELRIKTITVTYTVSGAPLAPTFSGVENKTYLKAPELTLTTNANGVEGVETYYTTDGTDPTSNESAVKYENGNIDLKLAALSTEIQTISLKAASKFVDGETTVWTPVSSVEFKYGIEMPTITPDPEDEKYDDTASPKTVTISQSQLGDVKLYVASADGEETATDLNYTEYSTNFTESIDKTKTYYYYAQYGETKTNVTEKVMLILDKTTTYIIPTGATFPAGSSVSKSSDGTDLGITLTFGGITFGDKDKKESDFENFKKSIDSSFGKKGFVSIEHLVYNKTDVVSEVGKNTDGELSGEYQHHVSETASQHDNTFALPAKGSFYKFEPEANGQLTVYVEQQGAIQHDNDKNVEPKQVRKRPVYFVDETGKSIVANYAYTTSQINGNDWKKVIAGKGQAVANDNFYPAEYTEKLRDFFDGIRKGENTTYTNFNSAVKEDKKHSAVVYDLDYQPIIVLHTEENADILSYEDKKMGTVNDATYDQTGYMLIGEGLVKYRFHVQAGKTYYLFGWRTKLALAGFTFEKDENYSVKDNVTLDGSSNNTAKINALEEGAQYNVTLKNRKFTANKWYTLVLPFSVSQKQMKEVFGDDVVTVHYDGVEGVNLNLFEHFYKMAVGGTPLLVKPSKDVTEDITFSNVTLTSKQVVDIESNGYKCTGSWDNVDFPKYSYFIDAKTNTFYQYDPEKVNGGVTPHAGAFRTWIMATGNAKEAKRLTMNINGISDAGETTGIWNAISGTEDTVTPADGIYTLNGQKVAAKSVDTLPKGIYIVNGKKYIVK